MAAGDLDVVPGSQVADTYPLTPFGEDNNVLVLFHNADARSALSMTSRGNGTWLGCNDMTAYRVCLYTGRATFSLTADQAEDSKALAMLVASLFLTL